MNKNVPDDWKFVKFGEVVQHVKDRFPNRDEWTFDRFINGGHIDSGQIRITKSSPIKGNEETIGSAFHMRFKPGHVLYVSRRAYLRKGGIVDFEGICSNVTFVLQADETKLLQSLLPFIIQTEAFVKHTVDNSHGSTNPFLNWKDIESYKMILPPLEKQKKISEILWSIEDNIQKTEKLIETTEKLKQELLNELLTKGIGHTRFKDSELGRIPEEWEVVELGDYSKDIRYGYTDSASEIIVGPKFLRITDIQEGNVIWNNVPYCNCSGSDFEKYQLIDGDIVFARTGATTGKSYLIKNPPIAVFASYLIRVRINELFYPEFVSHFFKSSMYWTQINSHISGSAQGGVNAKKLSSLKIVLPKLEEQLKISKFFENTESTIEVYVNHVKKLSELKRKLTLELLSGKLNI